MFISFKLAVSGIPVGIFYLLFNDRYVIQSLETVAPKLGIDV